ACPAAFTQLPDGDHDLCVTATDASGLAGAATCRHWEQQTNPTATFTAAPPDATTATGFTFTYASNKPVATFECRLDGAAFAPCAATGTTVAGLADGAHTFAVRATFKAKLDGVARTGPATTGTWTVDTTPPDTTITAGPADGASIVDVAPTFEFASEPGATFTCSVDGTPAAPCASPFTTPVLAAGSHTVAVAATDGVGN